MSECFIDIVRNGKRYSISDYIEAYDNDIAFDEVTYISTSLITSIPTDDFFTKFKNLKYINLPNITELPSGAFLNCTKLEEVIFPKVSILSNGYIFRGCSNLSKVKFHDNLEIKSTASQLFSGCFKLYNLTNVICNENFPSYAFCYCSSLTNFVINGSCSNIGPYAFMNCVTLNTINAKNVCNISYRAFGDCYRLKQVALSNNISSIAGMAFYRCSELINVNSIISNTEYIGEYAFEYCNNIKELSINGNPSISISAFDNCNNLSKIYAPNLTTLQGLPYVKDMELGRVIAITQILVNNYFYPILDLSTVEHVASRANLNKFEIIRLENCYSFCVIGNIGSSITQEVSLPKWDLGDPHFNKTVGNMWSTYGFAGYRSYYATENYYYYSDLHLSKLILLSDYFSGSINSTIMNSINFPQFRFSSPPTSSNIALYSCVEFLGLYNCSMILDRHVGMSPWTSPFINYFSKLSTIITNQFITSQGGNYYISSVHNIIYGSLRSIYFTSSGNAKLTLYECDGDVLPSILDIYGSSNEYFTAFISGNFNVNFSGLSQEKLYLNILDDSAISSLYIPHINKIELVANGVNSAYRCMNNLQNLSVIDFTNTVELIKGSNIHTNYGYGPFYGISYLDKINMPKLKYIDNFYGMYSGGASYPLTGIFGSCGHIDELYLPELIGYSTDFSVSESLYRGFRVHYTTFNKVTLGLYSILSTHAYMFNTNELNLPRCSTISIYTGGGYTSNNQNIRIGFNSNIKKIVAPLCNNFVIDTSTAISSTTPSYYYPINFKIESLVLSEYVDNFRLIGLTKLSSINFKTSGSYSFSNYILGGCYSLKNIRLQANNDIILNTTAKGVYSEWYSDVSSHFINIDNIYLIAGNMISLSKNAFGNGEIKNFILSASNIYLDSCHFPITKYLNIKAETLQINSSFFYCGAGYSKYIQQNGDGLIILDTPTYISIPFFYTGGYSSVYSLINPIIKVRASLLDSYINNTEWQKYSNIKFIEL